MLDRHAGPTSALMASPSHLFLYRPGRTQGEGDDREHGLRVSFQTLREMTFLCDNEDQADE